jgi:hypothetical protein
MEKTLNEFVMPAQAGIQFLKRFWIPAFAGMTLLLTYPALAADEPKPSTYSPEYCEFAVTFPGEPYTIQRCDENDDKKCYDLISYTQVYDMTETVNFRVICSKIGEDVYKSYSAEVMAATLRAMTDKNIIKTFDTTFREEENYKQAGLVGEGQTGRSSTVYIAQLWIGSHSALSLEAEMIGGPSEKGDKLFSNVLKSVHFKDPPKEEEKADEEKKPEEEKKKEEEPTAPAL